MGANGTHKRALTPFIHNATQIQTDIFPAVSPNGRRIAFARLGTGGIASRVFVMGIHGSRARPVTPNKYEAWAPDWSPNGNEITFSSQLVRFGSSVFTTKPDGSSIHRLTPDRFPNNDAGSAYSPRGNRIVFTSDRKHANFCCNDLFSIASGGGNDREIHTGKAAGILDPAWGTAPLIR
jgi:Tol biopolymer transport system component